MLKKVLITFGVIILAFCTAALFYYIITGDTEIHSNPNPDKYADNQDKDLGDWVY